MTKKDEFQTSTELKRLFLRELDLWRKRHGLGVADLSARCGVSPSYLAHIGRYGRVPSKPVLILLALNFETSDPAALFRAANLDTSWPYDGGTHGITKREEHAREFLTVKFDVQSFMDSLTQAIREEIRPRKVHE